MTLNYSYAVSTARFGTFVKLLFRWKGSIYSLLYRELIIYLCIYFILSATYRCLLNAEMQTTFEQICLTCVRFADYVPITMVLGFYVSWVIKRWWDWYLSILRPDRVCLLISALVCGENERGRMIRRTLVRYLNLSQLLVLRRVSLVARKRFPELHHVQDAGFMTEKEMELFVKLAPWTVDGSKVANENDTFWIPLQWFCTLCARARKEGHIAGDPQLTCLIEECTKFRDTLMNMIFYDWVSIPLVYTQVCTLAVYTYFVTCLLSRQYLNPAKGYKNHAIDLYFPFFTVLDFIFYVGWLKVAESLMSPMGEQTDHFEVNYMIDRNTIIAFTIVDTQYGRTPSLQKDEFWNKSPEIPHTLASAGLMDTAYVGSAETFHVPQELYAEAPPRRDSIINERDKVQKKLSVAFLQQSAARQGRRFFSVFNQETLNKKKFLDDDLDNISTGSEKLPSKTHPITVPIRNMGKFNDGNYLNTIYEAGPRTSNESVIKLNNQDEISKF